MNLETLLSQKGLVLQAPNMEEIKARAILKQEPIKVFYGETYDEYGNTVDSMKYYFFVSEFAKSLENEGYKAEPIILIADTAACRNVSTRLKEKFFNFGEERKDFVKKVNQVYGLNLSIIKMSDFIENPEFQ
jgi:hypothetical protein